MIKLKGLPFYKKNKPWRRGGEKHTTPHRFWLQPDETLTINTRKYFCHRCLRHKKHPIHNGKYRRKGQWTKWVTACRELGFPILGHRLEDVVKCPEAEEKQI